MTNLSNWPHGAHLHGADAAPRLATAGETDSLGQGPRTASPAPRGGESDERVSLGSKGAGIVVHDYCGHPFQIQLSRELARRGHRVLHLHCGSFRTGKGAVGMPEPRLTVEAITLSREFARYSSWTRVRQEREYGRRASERIRGFSPDVVISANTPLIAQRILLAETKRSGSRFVFWQQDVLGTGIKRVLERRYPCFGGLIGRRFVALERSILRGSDAVVAISPGFLPVLESMGLPSDKTHVVENWAPIDELPQRPRDNPWARRHGLNDRRVLLYSGTLGLKHDPAVLASLARAVRRLGDVDVVVVSEGRGADWLLRLRNDEGLDNLRVLPFQPYADLPDVLASADILLALLEADAGTFSVPSKVLSYLCAGRPLLAAIPPDNLAADVIRRSNGGVLAQAGDTEGFVAGAIRLLENPALRSALGRHGRVYAEESFDVKRIGEAFEQILFQPRHPQTGHIEPDSTKVRNG
jgi:colanic acid biosynthesis glycosyl transferase WcaI